MEWTQRKPITGGGLKYGLQLKISAPAAKKAPLKKPQPFAVDDDDDDFTVEDDIARQALKKQSAHEVDVQIKHALEQDASAFAYDDVYDEMKGKQAQPIREERAKREPKYIGRLIDKAKVRAVEQDMAFERRLAKERQKEDHLFGDKETFVTAAYKKKLIEDGKWKEEERRRDEREKAHEVSGKRDLSDFYRNLLQHNVAFGGKGAEQSSKIAKQKDEAGASVPKEKLGLSSDRLHESSVEISDREDEADGPSGRQKTVDDDSHSGSSAEASASRDPLDESNDASSMPDERGNTTSVSSADLKGPAKPVSKEDAVAAAKERYLARKRQRKE